MLEAIRQLEEWPDSKSAEALDTDGMLRFGTVKLVEVIGEAANMLSKELRAAHPEVPWPLIIGMRHRLVHDYFRIDTSILAEVVDVHLPVLKEHLLSIIPTLPE